MRQDIAAAVARGQRWDVVSFSFGANNIGLGTVAESCLDVDPDTPMTWTSDRWGTCQEAIDGLTPQIAALTGSSSGGKFVQGTLPLWRTPSRGESLIGQLSEITAPGGTILVHGYPQLFANQEHVVLAAGKAPASLVEEVGNCDGLAFRDIGKVRSAVRDLNGATKKAVTSAASTLADRRVEIAFVDPNDVFETGGEQHGLCSKEPWINGPFGPGALHPTGEGHQAMGEAVARVLKP